MTPRQRIERSKRAVSRETKKIERFERLYARAARERIEAPRGSWRWKLAIGVMRKLLVALRFARARRTEAEGEHTRALWALRFGKEWSNEDGE
jgi:hypothetical protein